MQECATLERGKREIEREEERIPSHGPFIVFLLLLCYSLNTERWYPSELFLSRIPLNWRRLHFSEFYPSFSDCQQSTRDIRPESPPSDSLWLKNCFKKGTQWFSSLHIHKQGYGRARVCVGMDARPHETDPDRTPVIQHLQCHVISRGLSA